MKHSYVKNSPLLCPYSSTFIQHFIGLEQFFLVNVTVLPTAAGVNLAILGSNPVSELLYLKGKDKILSVNTAVNRFYCLLLECMLLMSFVFFQCCWFGGRLRKKNLHSHYSPLSKSSLITSNCKCNFYHRGKTMRVK